MTHHFAEPGRARAVCRHCPADLVQLPSGAWVDDAGFTQCAKATGPFPVQPMLHEPMPVPLPGGANTLVGGHGKTHGIPGPLETVVLRLMVGAAGADPAEGACLTGEECQLLFAELERLRNPELAAARTALAAAAQDWDEAREGTGAAGQRLADAARALLAQLDDR